MNTKFHFYADDTIVYSSASSLANATKDLQSAFNVVQQNLHELRLVLNIDIAFQKVKNFWLRESQPTNTWAFS